MQIGDPRSSDIFLAGWAEHFMRLRAVARGAPAALDQLHVVTSTVAELSAERAVREAKRQRLEAQAREELPPDHRVTPPPPARPRWPGRMRQQMADASTNTAKADAEEKERARWVDELVQILIEADTPAVHIAAETPDPQKTLRRAAAGRRAKTLRKKVRSWKAFRKYLLRVYGQPWPTSATQMAEYADVRAQEPCGATFFDAFCQAASFMEKAGGFQHDDMLSAKDWFKNQIADMKAHACILHPKGTALRFPICFIHAWERLVSDPTEDPYARMFVWMILVMWWSTLRWDDGQWVDVDSMRLDKRGFSATLRRTKTTGSDKKVVTAQAFVSSQAWLTNQEWLSAGFELWNDHYFRRDFLLPLPTPDLQGFAATEARYEDAAAMLRIILARTPSNHNGVPDEASRLWTLHSPRHGLPAAATAIGVESKLVDFLGAWRAQAGQLYADQRRLQTEKIQRAVAEAGGGAWGYADIFNDEDVIQRYRAHLEAHGSPPETIHSLCNGIQPMQDADTPVKCQSCAATSPNRAISTCPACLAVGCSDCILGSICLACLSTVKQEDPDEIQGVGAQSEEQVGASAVPKEEEGYVVCITNKTSTRMLHWVGACWRVPGISYRTFEWLGREIPDPSSYNAICKDCWKDGNVGVEDRAASAAFPTDECSTSSSSEET